MSLSIPGLVGRDCVSCDNVPTPSCSDSCDLTTQDCVKVSKDCNQCATIRCIPKAASTKSKGVSQGTLAGAVVGVLAFLAIAIGVFFWYKRSYRLRRAAPVDERDKPASAADVLNRPDPTEKSLSLMSAGNIGYAPHPDDIESQPLGYAPVVTRPTSMRSNPFSDGHSIQTTGTEGTNVIPIALVAPDHAERRADSPSRPTRSPELMLNLDHVNVSHDNLKPGAGSLRSGITNVSRNSYMTNASYASDLINEAPMIMTPKQSTIRKVVGAVKAEIVDPRTPITPSADAFKKPGVSSPLANTSFGRPESNTSEDPFSDAHISMQTTLGSISDKASITTFGQSSTGQPSPTFRQTMNSELEGLPWENNQSRPTSMSTQAGSVIGSVIDIGSATRVNVSNGSLYRTMVGRLVTPGATPTSTGQAHMQEEQRKAAQAYAELRQSSAYDLSRRNSGHSAISATADSILEAFPFVPPSPISNRPVRTPPVSPLAKQNFTVTPASPASTNFQDVKAVDGALPPPPDRRTLGMSTGSQLSTASTGLGSFPFHIETSEDTDIAPSAYNAPRQRASLDTLAITADLSSYPLGYDKKQ